jgi:hypothetical protein
MSEIEPRGYFGLALFTRLTEHLYVHIGDSKTKLARMALDPVPNRHAAIHGLVVYSSFKNSLNTLFMTDYIFQVIDALKRNAAKAESDQTH